MAADGRRRVLLVGVGSFPAAPADREPRTDEAVFAPLSFAHNRIAVIEEVFGTYVRGGFEVATLLDPDEDALDEAVNDLLVDRSVTARIVHIVSHGRTAATKGWLEVITSGECTGRNELSRWVSRAQFIGIYTLFLFDLCHAGTAVNLEFSREIGADQIKAWVFGAARSYEQARDGRFSLAVAEVLRDCATNGLGMDDSIRYVHFGKIGERISDLLKGQGLTSTKIASHEASILESLPFFPNPQFLNDPVTRQVRALDPSLQAFLEDAVADHQHFRSRAGIHFTGRRAELETLVPWVDGYQQGSIKIVTGTAGAGKSALLGALVCAAHPALRRIAPAVGSSLPWRPHENHHIVAIHARQRRLSEIMDSVVSQLGLTWPSKYREPATLVEMISVLIDPPLVVLDALDESPDHEAVQALLLLPLATALRDDMRPVCRLLIGVRPWQEFGSLLALARQVDGLVDLDQVDPKLLFNDLRDFLLASMNGSPFAEEIAGGVAAALASDFEHRQKFPANQRQGQFLVAGRYADYLSRRPATRESDVERLLANVPTELSEVLELELANAINPRPLRAVLAALAFAKGEGMPQEVAHTVSGAFGGSTEDLLDGDAARLYLRLGIDRDGTSLYRLYHQGLADYLRRYPRSSLHPEVAERDVFDTILASRRDGAGQTWWNAAPAYLKRHAINHAVEASAVDELLTDPGFLVYADPLPLMLELDHASSPSARLVAAIYRTSYHQYGDDAEWRRRLLSLNSARFLHAHLQGRTSARATSEQR